MSKTAKPVVVISQRHLPTELAELIAYNDANMEISEHMIKKVPGVLAFFQSNNVENRSMVHDIQIFNSFESFMAHADMGNEELKQPPLLNLVIIDGGTLIFECDRDGTDPLDNTDPLTPRIPRTF